MANMDIYRRLMDGKCGFGYKETKKNQNGQRLLEKAPQDNPFSFLVAVIRGDIAVDNTLSSLENNLIAMEILEAAKRSAENGEKVKFPVEPKR